MSYIISIYFEKRRKKSNGKYSVKLRVYNKFNKTKIVRYFTTGIDLTEKEFETIWINPKGLKLRGKNKETYLKLIEFEKRANDVAKAMTLFDFTKFEIKLFRKSSDNNNLKHHFDLIIDDKLKNNKIGTAEAYKYARDSFIKFSMDINGCNENNLTLNLINSHWLRDYQNYMLSNNKSITTISIYIRHLRSVFNKAIDENDITKDMYPFGKKGYKIPRTKKVKKALNSEQLKALYVAEVTNDNEQKAKDFWFFSYSCNGMNLKDIALLKYSDIEGDKFNYYRAKTFDKSAEKILITIYLTDFTRGVIEKYGNKKKSGYVFDVVDINDAAEIQYKKVKNFTRYINDHIKRIALKNDLPSDISSYWARHSFATNSLRKGASMEFISEALNHSDLSVTKNYFAGFEDEAKKEFANSLLDF